MKQEVAPESTRAFVSKGFGVKEDFLSGGVCNGKAIMGTLICEKLFTDRIS